MITFNANMILLSLRANVTVHWGVKTVAVLFCWRPCRHWTRWDYRPMTYSADNGCRAVTTFPFQCTNAWWSFYMYISFFLFHLSFYIVFTTACTCQEWQIKLFNQSIIRHPSLRKPFYIDRHFILHICFFFTKVLRTTSAKISISPTNVVLITCILSLCRTWF